MRMNNELAKVLCDLEYEIGSECYNPHSYDGWNDIEGCDFRYPINYPSAEGEYMKIYGNIKDSFLLNISNESVTPDQIKYIKYKFGANELFIGRGLINVLTYLEERYNLNFEELERTYQKKM